MATISGYDSSSISVLFSSLNKSSSSSSSLFSSSSDLLGINYSDYATIRNGSYYKLMKAYYTLDGSDSEVSSIVSNTSTSKDSTKKLASIESNAESLKEAADALLEKGSKNLFEKKTVTEDGKTSTQYDTDAIYDAVKKFADNYNDLIDATEESNTSNITNAAKRLVNLTKANEKLLEEVGITVDEDNKLVVDEEKFKKADMDTVKSLFNTTGGYGYQVDAQASMINYYAESEASKSNTYGSYGSYTYNYSTGELYNTSI